jgi:lipoprotein-releasing system permease protein
LSTAATAVSVMAMIITLSFVNGFQKTVGEKVFSFWGHIRVQHFETNKSLVSEENPIRKNDTVLNIIKQQSGVEHVQAFATKSAVLEKKREIEGILFKGIEKDYDSSQLKPFLVKGRWLNFNDSLYSREIIVSQLVADIIKAQLNDTINVHFISPQAGTATHRPVKVVGIYKTGIEEYDNKFAIGDLRLIRRLSDWQPDEIGGYEIFIKDYKLMDSVSEKLDLPTVWASKTVKEVYPNIFDWLGIQDVNRNVVFIVMAIVAIINLVTCLLILVLERTRMVGILKAVGSTNGSIQQIFLYHAGFITLMGVGIGFIAGVGICLLQQYTGFISLDESTYYVSKAPVHIVWWQVALVCAGTAIVCFLSLIVPTLLVRSIKPVKAIQFR